MTSDFISLFVLIYCFFFFFYVPLSNSCVINSTYSGKTIRRSIISIGLVALVLLAFQTGWEITQIISNKKETPFTDLWRKFDESTLGDNAIWFNALIQVLFSTNIGTGILPVVTGKFLYKGDAVRLVIKSFISIYQYFI